MMTFYDRFLSTPPGMGVLFTKEAGKHLQDDALLLIVRVKPF